MHIKENWRYSKNECVSTSAKKTITHSWTHRRVQVHLPRGLYGLRLQRTVQRLLHGRRYGRAVGIPDSRHATDIPDAWKRGLRAEAEQPEPVYQSPEHADLLMFVWRALLPRPHAALRQLQGAGGQLWERDLHLRPLHLVAGELDPFSSSFWSAGDWSDHKKRFPLKKINH